MKSRRHIIEADYINGVPSVTGEGQGMRPLTDEEKSWLNRFYGEYNNASVVQNDPERLAKQMHNTKELAKDCTDMNNKRNVDVLVQATMRNFVSNVDWRQYEIADMDSEDIETIQSYFCGEYEIGPTKKKKD